MNEFVCTGLDGANPLHALAAFGLLRLGDRLRGDQAFRLSWRLVQGRWNPVLSHAGPTATFLAEVAVTLVTLATVSNSDKALTKRVRELGAKAKRLEARIKEVSKGAKADAKARGLDRQAQWEHVDAESSDLRRELEETRGALAVEQSRLAVVNGTGIAHLGDVIGVDQEILRATARSALDGLTGSTSALGTGRLATDDPKLVLAQLPALACDQIHESGKLVPTPFSFGNGASGQCLLKDFRACATAVTLERLEAAIAGRGDACVAGRTGLNWDPAEQVSYALTWREPATAVKSVPVATHALAYLGLSLLPCVPRGSRLDAVGWGPGKAFSWPLWEDPLSLDATKSLLGLPQLVRDRPDLQDLHARGIAAVHRSLVVNPTGKRNFFAPSRPVA